MAALQGLYRCHRTTVDVLLPQHYRACTAAPAAVKSRPGCCCSPCITRQLQHCRVAAQEVGQGHSTHPERAGHAGTPAAEHAQQHAGVNSVVASSHTKEKPLWCSWCAIGAGQCMGEVTTGPTRLLQCVQKCFQVTWDSTGQYACSTFPVGAACFSVCA